MQTPGASVVTHWRWAFVVGRVQQVTTEQPTFLSEADLVHELRVSRLAVDRLLYAIKDFTVLAHEQPWVHLDDLMRELRAAATTVATLEGIQARYTM